MANCARVKMAGRGCLTVLCPEQLGCTVGVACLVMVEYGETLGWICELFGQPDEVARPGGFVVTRLATEDDLTRSEDNLRRARLAREAFVRSVSREKQRIKVIDARFSIDRSRLRIYFGAQEQVDLRRYVGQIQRDFHTQVDLCQIGVRDEASIVGGVAVCGRPLCCASWHVDARTVNLRMAKVQEVSLNPVATNGMCGRLKCCMQYEFEQYREAAAALPESGMRCATPDGEGIVVARDVMRGLVTVRLNDGRFVKMPAGNVTETKRERPETVPAGKGQSDVEANQGAERAESAVARDA